MTDPFAIFPAVQLSRFLFPLLNCEKGEKPEGPIPESKEEFLKLLKRVNSFKSPKVFPTCLRIVPSGRIGLVTVFATDCPTPFITFPVTSNVLGTTLKGETTVFTTFPTSLTSFIFFIPW